MIYQHRALQDGPIMQGDIESWWGVNWHTQGNTLCDVLKGG
jgi:hypothetical protein